MRPLLWTILLVSLWTFPKDKSPLAEVCNVVTLLGAAVLLATGDEETGW